MLTQHFFNCIKIFVPIDRCLWTFIMLFPYLHIKPNKTEIKTIAISGGYSRRTRLKRYNHDAYNTHYNKTLYAILFMEQHVYIMRITSIHTYGVYLIFHYTNYKKLYYASNNLGRQHFSERMFSNCKMWTQKL